MVRALREAAAYDPCGEALYGERSHDDGWGILIARLDGSAALHHRSTRPIFSSGSDPESVIPGWAAGAPVVLMAHARKASEGTPVDLASAYPVHASSAWGDLYIVHNGSFDRGKLDSLIGEAAPHSDTWAAAVALASRIRGGVSRRDLEWLLGAERTGANLGIALLGAAAGPRLSWGATTGSAATRAIPTWSATTGSMSASRMAASSMRRPLWWSCTWGPGDAGPSGTASSTAAPAASRCGTCYPPLNPNFVSYPALKGEASRFAAPPCPRPSAAGRGRSSTGAAGGSHPALLSVLRGAL